MYVYHVVVGLVHTTDKRRMSAIFFFSRLLLKIAHAETPAVSFSDSWLKLDILLRPGISQTFGGWNSICFLWGKNVTSRSSCKKNLANLFRFLKLVFIWTQILLGRVYNLARYKKRHNEILQWHITKKLGTLQVIS